MSMHPIHLKTALHGPVSIENTHPNEETIEELIQDLFNSKILDDDTDLSRFKIMFNYKIIKTNEELQYVIKQSNKDDPIQLFIVKIAKTAGITNNNNNNNNEIISKSTKATSPGIMDIFQAQVEKYPDCVAASYRDNLVTFAELDKKANQLAAYLTKNYRVGPNVPIAIMGSNKLEMLVCELAILKTGSCFVPFTPDIPKERLDFTLKNSGTKLAISCDQKSDPLLSNQPNCKVLHLNKAKQEIDNESTDPYVSPPENPDNLAYILYTSGSTSNPKGVMQTRGGLQGQIINYTDNLKLSHEDHFLQLAPLTHDQAIVDIYGALRNGAELHFFDLNIENLEPETIQKLVVDKKISIFSSIPSVFSQIFNGVPDDQRFPSLRIVTLGGEAVKKDHVALYQKIAPSECLFVNGYGATEFSWISYYVIKKNDPIDQLDQIPLGLMAHNTEVFLDLQKGDNIQEGELCVSSPYMSPGYWKNDEATSQAFFMHNGKEYYRTGDLASQDDEKNYHFKGRLAWHEKINGKRVSLKDVEDEMRKQFPIEECVVMSYGEEDKKLVAFYTIKADSPEAKAFQKLNPNEIRMKMKKFLQRHEIPSKLYVLEQFPQLYNAKVNRQELKNTIETDVQERNDKRRTDINLDPIDTIISEVLDLGEAPEAGFNLLENGASSIDMARITNKLNEYLDRQNIALALTIPEIYGARTISGIKKLIAEKKPPENSPKYTKNDIYDYDRFPLIYKDETNKAISMNYSSLEVLANFYNKKYGITIIPCDSQETFIKLMTDFVNSGKTGKIGLTWPRNNYKEHHHTACILEVEQQNASLFISDSVGRCPFTKHDKVNPMKLHYKLPVKFYMDPYARQDDANSCFVDIITFLKDGLRMDLLHDLRVIPRDQIVSDLSKDTPQEMIFFQSPLDILKTSQSPEFPKNLNLPIDQDEILKLDKNKTTFKSYREKTTEESTYIVSHDSQGTPLETSPDTPPFQKTQNIAYFKQGKKYKKIVDNATGNKKIERAEIKQAKKDKKITDDPIVEKNDDDQTGRCPSCTIL